jgi:hypothetical protein
MKNTTCITLVTLALLTTIIALFTSGTVKYVQRKTQLQHETTVIRMNAAHDEIARYYALRLTAKLP